MSKLQYDSKNVKEFLSLLQVITEGASFGVEEKVYEASYKLIGSKDLGTVYLCFLIGKLLSFEAKIAQSQVISVSKSVNVSDLNQQDNEFDNLSVEDVFGFLLPF